jgi:glycerophosphoryl diester phosphodiesterase
MSSFGGNGFRVDTFFGDGPWLFAHRGFHSESCPENSVLAFEAAKKANFGIELDVTLCKTGELVLFHDDRIEDSEDIERPHDLTGRIHDLSFGELEAVTYKKTGAPLGLLKDALEAVGGAVPMVIEIKIRELFNWKRARESAKAVMDVLVESGYPKDRLLLASFHPKVLAALRELDESYFRSLIVQSYVEHSAVSRTLWQGLMNKLPMSEQARPDVLMTEHELMDQERMTLRTNQGYRMLPWLTDHRNVLRGIERPEESIVYSEAVCKMSDLGVAGLITDHPKAAATIRALSIG